MNGILGVLPPGLRGYVAGEQMQNQRGVNQLQQMHGILGLQGMLEQRAMEQQIAPLKMKLLQAQVQGVENPAPTKIDGGGEWLFIDKTGNVVGRIPKTASPDTVLKEGGADRRHGQVSGNTAATIGNQQYLHGIPSASSLLGAQVSLAGMNRPVLNETLGGWLTPPPVGVPGIGAPRLPQAPQGQMPSAMDSTPRISPNMMVSPQDQARRDADAARIRAAESNGGAGFVPTSSAIPGFTPVPGLAGRPKGIPAGYEPDPAKPGAVRPIAGGPADVDKSSDTERVASGYANRMIESGKILADLEKKGVGKPEILETMASAGYGEIGKVASNLARSPERQRYRQAQEDWVRAKLRKESGAVIADDEMDREIRVYFPQIGDDAKTVAQKAVSRAQAEQGMINAAGRAYKPAEGLEFNGYRFPNADALKRYKAAIGAS
jgi:hypothetical protein